MEAHSSFAISSLIRGIVFCIMEFPLKIRRTMSRRCEICGKEPLVGHSKSHAHNLTKRRWLPNLQRVRVIEGGTVRHRDVCTSCIQAGKIQKAPSRRVQKAL